MLTSDYRVVLRKLALNSLSCQSVVINCSTNVLQETGLLHNYCRRLTSIVFGAASTTGSTRGISSGTRMTADEVERLPEVKATVWVYGKFHKIPYHPGLSRQGAAWLPKIARGWLPAFHYVQHSKKHWLCAHRHQTT